MRLRHLSLRVQTSGGPFGTDIHFPDGLVVVWADNSMGKSTCVRSILVALGFEAILTTSQTDLPLAPAMKSIIEGSDGIHHVLESSISLQIENLKGEAITVQRTIKGQQDSRLITVYHGGMQPRNGVTPLAEDFFVGRSGSATRERGFHQFLAQFLGWNLPLVQTFDGKDRPLYLQCLFPFLFVEQTRGWSAIQPPIPTHFQIKDVHKRSIEFLLNMDAHSIALRRAELFAQKQGAENEWIGICNKATLIAKTVSGVTQSIPHRPPVSWPAAFEPTIIVPERESWIPIEEQLARHLQSHARLIDEEIPKVREIAETASIELSEREQELRDKEAILSRIMQSLELERAEVESVRTRLLTLEEDIRKNNDIKALKNMGSKHLPHLLNGICPACQQPLQDSLLPVSDGQSIMSIDENINFLNEQKRTFLGVLTNAERRVVFRENQARAIQAEIQGNRELIRSLRQTLISDGRMPSIAAIEARLKLEASITQLQSAIEQFNTIVEELGALAERVQQILAELAKMPRDDTTLADKEKIGRWSRLFVEQLQQYGFRSLVTVP